MTINRRPGESLVVTPKKEGGSISLHVLDIDLEGRTIEVKGPRKTATLSVGQIFSPAEGMEFKVLRVHTSQYSLTRGNPEVVLSFNADAPYFIDRGEVYRKNPDAARRYHFERGI